MRWVADAQTSHRGFGAEPLEGRWLLSGGPVQSFPGGAATGPAVEVIEVERGSHDAGDVKISPGDAPARVREALGRYFPGAPVRDALFSPNDGSPEYELKVSIGRGVNRAVVGVTLDQDGNLVETAESLASVKLPSAVLDWVRTTFSSGAVIDRATVVTRSGAVSYDVGLVVPGGGQVDASLRVVKRVDPKRGPSESGSRAPSDPPVAPHFSGGAGEILAAGSDAGVTGGPGVVTATSTLGTVVAGREILGTATRAIERVASGVVAMWAAHADVAVRAPLAVASGGTFLAAAAVRVLPAAADSHGDVPAPTSAVGERLTALLARVDSLAEALAGEGPTGTNARLTLATFLLAGSGLLYAYCRSGGGGRTVPASAAASWSWVLGGTRPSKVGPGAGRGGP